MTEQLGRYEILEEIGQGGFAIVHRARDTELNRLVALKELRATMLQDADWVRRFKREARTIAGLDHHRIVTIYDVVDLENRLFIVMRLVDGSSLEEVIAAKKAGLTWSETIEIFSALAEGLDFAHQQDILHRDLKPANVLMDSVRGPLLTDFGLAKLEGGAGTSMTADGGIVGTPQYIAPEVWEGQGSSRQSDIYALGCILYEMLIGEKLFGGTSPPAVMMAHFSPPTLPDTWPDDVPPGVVKVLEQALAKQPDDRYTSPIDIVTALQQLSGTPAKAVEIKAESPRKAQADEGGDQDTLTQIRHNLPSQPTSFIGRTEELAALDELITNPEVRLITIVGPGGMGKTRLSLAAAKQQLKTNHFSNGIYFVPLAPLRSAADIVTTIADAVGYPFQVDERSAEQQLLEYFQPKRTLLVLDNFEQVLDGVAMINTLLQAAPQVKVLASSRERLKLSGETVFVLDGMEFPETSEDALRYHAVELFMHSARRIRLDFELGAGDLTYIARICRQVQGMPLGILLAAAWVEMLSPQEIAEEIGQSLDILETELRDVPERQRSIRAVFDYSWWRLSEAQRDAFMKLSLFRGGFTREAVQAITGATLRDLTALVSKSLLRRESEGRYEVHELLRQYAEQELAASGKTEAIRDAHSGYYADFLQQREAGLKGQRQVEALNEIEADFENVRAAWQWAVQNKSYDAIDRALESLYWFCDMHNHFQEGQALLRLARERLAPPLGESPHPVWGRVVARVLGRYGVYLETPAEARSKIEPGLAIAQMHNNRAEIAFCLWRLGIAVWGESNLTEALVYLEQSLDYYQSLDDSFFIAQILNDMGHCYYWLGQPEKAMEHARQSLELRREIGDKFGIPHSLSSLAADAGFSGRIDEYEVLYEEALQIWRELGDQSAIAGLLAIRSYYLIYEGDFDAAQAVAEKAMTIVEEINDSRSRYRILFSMGLQAGLAEDYQKCRRLCLQAAESPEHWLVIGFVQLGLCLAVCGLGQFSTARQELPGMLNIPATTPVLLLQSVPLAAIMLADAGQKERSVELLSLFFHHPASITGWLEKWPLFIRLRAELEAGLPPEEFAMLWQRGQTLDLEETVKVLLAEIEEMPVA